MARIVAGNNSPTPGFANAVSAHLPPHLACACKAIEMRIETVIEATEMMQLDMWGAHENSAHVAEDGRLSGGAAPRQFARTV